jgi:hypothetical protein
VQPAGCAAPAACCRAFEALDAAGLRCTSDSRTHAPAAALGAYYYTSVNTGTQFVFNNTPVSTTAAQESCQTYGGNLVWYASLEEQQEVEAAFIERGNLVPSFHGSYWMGLSTAVLKPPQFAWGDVLAGKLNWTHWGSFATPEGNFSEPNNLSGQEFCGAANASQEFGSAWGWMDANCNTRMTFMCRLNRECGPVAPARMPPQGPSGCLQPALDVPPPLLAPRPCLCLQDRMAPSRPLCPRPPATSSSSTLRWWARRRRTRSATRRAGSLRST